ncbi:MAG: hypothetical protein OXT06_09205 [Rhodospirillaceae bacterium]|nr:hypothetical protein [Rhodospirillaceae bacterium]
MADQRFDALDAKAPADPDEAARYWRDQCRALLCARVPPTKKQQRVLSFIQAFIVEHGQSPSIREIRDGLGLASASSAWNYVDRLVERGWVQKSYGRRRCIALL